MFTSIYHMHDKYTTFVCCINDMKAVSLIAQISVLFWNLSVSHIAVPLLSNNYKM